MRSNRLLLHVVAGCVIMLPGMTPSLAEPWVSGGYHYRSFDVEVSGSTYVKQNDLRVGRNITRNPTSFDATSTTSVDVHRSPVRSTTMVVEGGSSLGSDPVVGPVDNFADRTYDDGYVKIDPGTTFPTTFLPGLTWFWGYDNASQYDPAAHTLTFSVIGTTDISTSLETFTAVRETVTTTETVTTEVGQGLEERSSVLRNDDLAMSGDLSGSGFSLSTGYDFPSDGRVRFGIAGGVNAAFDAGRTFSTSTYRETFSSRRFEVRNMYVESTTVRETVTDVSSEFRENGATLLVADTFDLGPLPAPPPPGHRGTFEGPGPVIPNQPASRSTASLADASAPVRASDRSVSVEESSTPRRLISTEEVTTGSSRGVAVNHIALSIDSDVYEVWLGPTLMLHLDVGERLHVYATPHVSLHVVDWTVHRQENLYVEDGRQVAAYADSFDDQDILLGVGALVGAEMQVSDPWFVRVYGGVDHVFDDAGASVGPNQVNVDLSGYEFGFQLGMRFGGG